MTEPRVRFSKDNSSGYQPWRKQRLKDICSLVSIRGNGGGYIGTENMLPDFAGVDYSADREGSGTIFDVGDVLMSNIRPYLKKTWKADRAGVCSTDVLVFHANAVTEEYLYQIISNESFIKYVMSAAKGSKMPRGDKEHILSMELLVPCFEEQQKIADFLSSVDEVITASEEEVVNLETQKKAVMKKIFSQEVRFKKDDGTEFPEWEEKPFEEIASLITASIVPSKAGTMHCVELEHLEQGSGQRLGYVEAENQSSNKRLFETGDVLFGKLRPYLKKYWLATEDGCCSSEIWVLRPLSGVLSEYLLAIVSSDDFISVANTSEGTKMPRASWNLVANAEFPVPSFEEQRLIADFLSNFDEAIAAAKKELELWKELKKGLLQQMFV